MSGSIAGEAPKDTSLGPMHGMMFLSGMGALVFEVVWFNEIGLIVGNTVWSAALTVGAFMAGLALGNALAVRLARRWSDLVRGYGAVEAVAAVSGAAVVLAIPLLPGLFRPLLAPFLDQMAALNTVRVAIAFTLMAVPATALGASLPLLSKPLERSSGSYGFALGSLYGLNTLGAVAGTLLAEFVLVPSLGLRGSGIFAAACNLCAAGIALGLARQPAYGGAPAVSAPGMATGKRLVAAAVMSGAALLALEVVWFRLLLLLETGTTVMFAVMLAVVLGGIALGGIAAAAWARAGWHAGSAARLAAAGAAICVVLAYATFHPFYSRVGAALPYGPVRQVALMSIFLMGPVCVFSGVLFTALGDQMRGRGADAPTATGALTLANTVGAMAGSLVAAFALLPAIGMENSLFALALLYAGITIVAPGAGQRRVWRMAPIAAGAAALALFPFGTMRGTYYPSVEARFHGRIVEAREGVVQTAFYLVQDFLGEALHYRLVTNSHPMSGTAILGQRYMRLFAYLPAAFHPRIEDALVIAFGVGVTASAVAELPDVRRIDIVDVSRDILEMSDVVYGDSPRHPLRDRRVSVHVEDGRFFLQHARHRYDLITGEPPPPKMAGVAFLYTREYFALMRERLKPGGLATYWLTTNELSGSDTLAIIRAFCDAFADCSLWQGIASQWILMGSRDGVMPAPDARFSRLWRLPATRERLREIGLDSAGHLVAQFMADARQLQRVAASVEPLVDDFPRRLSPSQRVAAVDPLFAWLLDAALTRERLQGSRWLAGILTAGLLAEGVARLDERALLDAEFFPYLRAADHDYWSNLAWLLRQPGQATLKTWMLDSDRRKIEIAKARDPADPLVAEQLAVEALASGRPPGRTPVAHDRFMAMTPKGQVLTILRHCLAGEQRRARSLMAWIPEERRAADPYRSFLAWAARAAC